MYLRSIPVSAFLILLLVVSCSRGSGSEPGIQIKQDSEIARVKPKKPVRVQLKRKDSGEYSWDITGEDVDRIIETDRKLQKEYKRR